MGKTQVSGNRGEDISCEYLLSKGYIIVDRNFSCSYGEIDIIAIDGEFLVFVEVKTRKQDLRAALTSVSSQKKKKIVKASMIFLSENPELQENFTRFDVIAVTGEDSIQIEHIPDAFRSSDLPDFE